MSLSVQSDVSSLLAPKNAPSRSVSAMDRGSDEFSKLRAADKGRKEISSVPNAPFIQSPYEEKTRRLLQQNLPLATNRVHIPWYRRYTEVIPEKDQQQSHQPFREIQTRDEDIALQHQYGVHECMQDYVTRGMCKYPAAECRRIREAAMTRYNRIKKREEEKKEMKGKRGGEGQQQDDTFVMPGQDIDLTTEFGFSANKKKIVVPVVDFLMKCHVNRERDVIRRSLNIKSRWRMFSSAHPIRNKLQEAIARQKKSAARTRLRRLFNLVLYVDRFIKCVAMIAGDTQTLLKDTTHKSIAKLPISEPSREAKLEKEIAIFNVQHYQKVGQVQVPFHIQMILGKPWFCRSNKEVETAVRFLEKMRCFTAYPRQFQFMLARCAWYLELPTQKVVIRQSQQAVNFYLLLNGSVRIDRLEGSPCEAEYGYFKTLNVLSSQDMFGDECVTEPFSERWYTATTEERCAALDFNMHDYNDMIQTANTSEEAPDHIRFLCKLRIMDNFPKIKLLREQDTNVTYFFFRPGCLVCRSVRDSPFVFVIRNGSCSVLREIVPKMDSRKSTTSMAARPSRPAGSLVVLSEGWTKKQRDSKRPGTSVSAKGRADSSLFGNIKNRLSAENKEWFEKTQKMFEMSKAGMKESIKTMKDKSENIAKTMSVQMLEKFNLKDETGELTVNQQDGLEQTMASSSRRSSMVLPLKAEDVVFTPRLSRRSSLRWKVEGGTVPDINLESTQSFSESIRRKESGSKQSSSPGISNSTVGESAQRRRSKIVGTNIQITPERLTGESTSRVSNANVNNSAKNKGGGKGAKSGRVKLPDVFQAQMTGQQNNKKKAGNAASDKQARLKKKRELKSISLDPPVSRYSQWTQKALLTVTDVAGVEWLDYNDGTYKPPSEDTSLVSHGATIIMIKKEFMLKYLQKVW